MIFVIFLNYRAPLKDSVSRGALRGYSMKRSLAVLFLLGFMLSSMYAFTLRPSWGFGRIHIGGLFQKSSAAQLSLTGTCFELSAHDANSGFGFEFSPFYFSGVTTSKKVALFLCNTGVYYNTLETVSTLCKLSPFATFHWMDVRNFRAYRFETGLEFLFTPSASPFSEWKFPLIFKILSLRGGMRLDNHAKISFFCEAGIDFSILLYGGALAAEKQAEKHYRDTAGMGKRASY